MAQQPNKDNTTVPPKGDNLGGRPPLFDTPDELEGMIDGYFNGGANMRTIAVGGSPVEVPVYTMTGLALYLGFNSRQSLYDYEKKDGFSYIIKKAQTFIENVYEENLQIGNPTGSIFALKNMGWKDKVETEHSGEIKTHDKVNLTVNGEEVTLK